jgi:hypothetical protein
MLLNHPSEHRASAATRWLVRLVAVSAAVLLPWAAYLASTLPSSVGARHWPLTWTGLDVAMACGLAATAWLAVRRDRRLAFPAISSATLLLADAWFDVCMAPAGAPLTWALVDMFIEIAEAAACVALAVAVWRDGTSAGPGDASRAVPRGKRHWARHWARHGALR